MEFFRKCKRDKKSKIIIFFKKVYLQLDKEEIVLAV